MTRAHIEQKLADWAARGGTYVDPVLLDDAPVILSYNAGHTDTTLTDVNVRAAAVHTKKAHVFLFAEKTVWEIDAQGDTGKALKTDYCLIVAF